MHNMSANIIKTILEELNINSFTIEVYLKCVEIPEPTVTKLAKVLEVERSRIYLALEELVESGFVAQKEVYGRYISLNSPSKFIAKLRDREIKSRRLIEDFTKVLPDLTAQFSSNKNQPFIKIYEGKNQFISLFNEVLEEADQKEGFRIFGNVDQFLELIGFEYQREWSKQRIKKKIRSRILVFPSKKMESVTHTNQQDFREVRWLNPDHICQGYYYLFANKSIHWNPVLPKAIMIEDSVINSTFRSNFELLWEACGEN